MKKLLVCVLLLLQFTVFADETCEKGVGDNFKAEYSIYSGFLTKKVNYYREGSRVAYEYLSVGMTEVWTKLPKNRVSLTRVFNNYKRSIEYDTIDLEMENRRSSWASHKNFSFIKNIDYDLGQEEYVDGCKVWHYVKKAENLEINMYWDNKRDILISFDLKENNIYKYRYKLIGVKEERLSYIQKALAYDSTDYADIGDNESDPFFRKMISLGFISHKETNIIDEQGKALELAHK